MMLRQVHRRSKSYLITLEKGEATTVRKKISEGQVLGLDDVILATSESLDMLIDELAGYTYIKPPRVNIVSSTRIIE